MRLIPCALFCLVIAGCATQPSLTIPDTGLITYQAIASDFRIDREWWKAYGDKNLDRIVELAIANNTDLIFILSFINT